MARPLHPQHHGDVGQALADVATVRHADDDGRLTMREQASRLEWLLKWQLLEKLRRKTGSDWTDRRLAAVDLKWAALDPADSIFTRLAGQTERLVTDKQLAEGGRPSAGRHTRMAARGDRTTFPRTGRCGVVVPPYGARRVVR